MPTRPVTASIPGLERLTKKLDRLPKETQDEAIESTGKYLISEKMLGRYAKQRSVTRRAAYGKSFFSDKQRRWFFAKLRSGEIEIPYRRTMGLRRGWRVIVYGAKSIITNVREGAPFVVGNKTQSRHEKKVGWQTVGAIFKEGSRQIQSHLSGALSRAYRKAGFK